MPCLHFVFHTLQWLINHFSVILFSIYCFATCQQIAKNKTMALLKIKYFYKVIWYKVVLSIFRNSGSNRFCCQIHTCLNKYLILMNITKIRHLFLLGCTRICKDPLLMRGQKLRKKKILKHVFNNNKNNKCIHSLKNKKNFQISEPRFLRDVREPE